MFKDVIPAKAGIQLKSRLRRTRTLSLLQQVALDPGLRRDEGKKNQ